MKQAVIVFALLAAQAQAQDLGSMFVIDDVRERMPSLTMPYMPPAEHQSAQVVDSDPRTRLMAIEYLTAYSGFEWVKPWVGNRQHIEFKTGEARLTQAQKDELIAFSDTIAANDKVVIMAFTDQAGDNDVNQTLSQRRAQALEEHLAPVVGKAAITVIASTQWPGDPANARRAEAIVIKQ